MINGIKDIRIIVSSSTQDGSSNASKSLRRWLQAEDFGIGFNVKQERKSLQEDEAGGKLLPSLGVNINSSSLSDLGGSIFNWFKSKSGKGQDLNIIIKTNQGHEISISAQSIGEGEQQFIHNLIKLMDKTDGHSNQASNPYSAKTNLENWNPITTKEQWKDEYNQIQEAILNGKTKKAASYFNSFLNCEGLSSHQSILITRLAEWQRADQDFNLGTVERQYFDRKTNLFNKIMLDLLNEINDQVIKPTSSK